MASPSQSDRIAIATAFVAQAPPGELADVVTDVRVLFDNEELLAPELPTALATFHADRLTAVPVPWGQHKAIICAPAAIDEAAYRYLDPRAAKSFTFDPVTLAVSAEEDAEPSSAEAMRKDLESHLDTYSAAHYPNGNAGVYAVDPTEFHVVIASEKLNASNFWNAQWRSHWTWKEGKLHGDMSATVHYYEDGNVQLHNTHQEAIDVPADSTAEAVIKAIKKAESARHKALHSAYADMSEKVFRGLRRALPLTRTKLDWNKIANYKVGAELSGKAAASSSSPTSSSP
ncbi:F-actin-capping protein subunit alpha [Blastocladiella britannica]|nr:F-actin-capping protein subunit alpha [Blastocladiella britannica]